MEAMLPGPRPSGDRCVSSLAVGVSPQTVWRYEVKVWIRVEFN